MRIAARLLLGLGALLAAGPALAQPAAYDLVIRNGRVLDGAGNPWILADVAVKDGRIAKVGAVAGKGAREIDAAGRYVSPGWIDMMDQSGEVLLTAGQAENKLRMGVTTVIAGEGGTPVDAAEIPQYFARLERQGIGVNFGTYYSAIQARMKAMGEVAGAPTPAQMTVMKSEVAKAMKAGAFGITTALIYPPSSYASTAELVELAKEAGRCDGFYATHMRDESERLVQAIEEAVEIGEKGGVKVEIFHLKAAFKPKAGELMPAAVAAIDAARARGVDVAADMYPYTAGGTGLDITVPNWVWEQGTAAGLARLKDPKVRERLKRELAAGSMPGWSNLVHAAGGWDGVVLANPFDAKYEAYRFKSLAEIGKALGRDPADVAWDILIEGQPNRPMALFFMMDERDIETAMRRPWVGFGSDAAAAERFGETDALGLPHPRAYGTFPRVIAEYVKRRKVLTLEDAVRKLSAWPAARMGLADRGVIREGLKADLVVFDLDRIDDVASWTTPTAAPKGIEFVVVNGRLAIDDGAATGVLAGEVLRHPCRPG